METACPNRLEPDVLFVEISPASHRFLTKGGQISFMNTNMYQYVQQGGGLVPDYSKKDNL
jgi:hypothetical protein